jgi:hypothetical protein
MLGWDIVGERQQCGRDQAVFFQPICNQGGIMHYWVKISVSKPGSSIFRDFYVDALDCQKQLGNDILGLVIGYNCHVIIGNYDRNPPQQFVVDYEDFYEKVLAG